MQIPKADIIKVFSTGYPSQRKIQKMNKVEAENELFQLVKVEVSQSQEKSQRRIKRQQLCKTLFLDFKIANDCQTECTIDIFHYEDMKNPL